MNVSLWNSRLARRLIKIFLLLIVVPLAVTVLVLRHVGQQQILLTANVIERMTIVAAGGAGVEFQRIGGKAIEQSTKQATAVSSRATESVSKNLQQIQSQALSDTSREFSAIALTGFDKAMRESVATNQKTLAAVSDKMAADFTRSEIAEQQQAGGRMEKAMLELIGKSLEDRARHLSMQVSGHVANHLNYLSLASQQSDFLNHNVVGQKAALDALTRRYPTLMTVTVQDETGKETAMSCSDRPTTEADLGSHPKAPYFVAAMHDDQYIGVEPNLDARQPPVLDLAVPIELYKGKVVGVLAARLSLIDLWDTMRSMRVGTRGFVDVTDKSGRLLLQHKVVHQSLLTRSAEVDTLGWRVIVAEPTDEAMLPIQSLKADIAQNSKIVLAGIQADIQTSSREASARLQQNAIAMSRQTAWLINQKSTQVIANLMASTARQTDVQLQTMRQGIEAQAKHTQHESDHEMVRATNDTAKRLTTRVDGLTATALERGSSRMTLWALAILFASCIFGCCAALLLAKKIVHPILLLSDGTRAITQGDLEKKDIVIRGYKADKLTDEIDDLADAFNKMAHFLRTSRSDLKSAEAQLVQSAKLASLGTLSAGVAHELNQPVAIIRGITQQLVDDPSLSDDAREDLALIEGQTGRMVKIIKHLRTFSRSGGYEMVSVDVNKVVEDCFILTGAQLKAHDIIVDLQLDSNPIWVRGDANELEQVFLNLITNARDALEGVAEPTITIRTETNGKQVMLEFRDNGPGVPDTASKQIFDPFFTTKEAGKGTGLGLSISHTIIEKHQGTIQQRNDGGAVFTLNFPAETQAVEIAAKAA